MWGGSRGNDAVQPFNPGGGAPAFSVGGAMQQQQQQQQPGVGGAPRFTIGGQAPPQQAQGAYGGYGQQPAQQAPQQGGFQPQGGYGQPPPQQQPQGAARFMPSFPRSPQAQRSFQAGGREQAMPTFGAQAQQQQQQQSFGRRGGAQRGQMFPGQQQDQPQPDPNRVPRDSDPRELPKPAERDPNAPPPVFRIGGGGGDDGSDANAQSPRRFYDQRQGNASGASGGAQGDAGGGGALSFFNRGMAAAAQRMVAPCPTAAGRKTPLLTSVSLQYYYYFGICWDVTFVLFTFAIMIWKGIKMPYPKYDYQTRDYESVWSIEFAFLFVFIIFEWPRLSLLNKANRGTHHLTMYASILLAAPVVAYHLWGMFSATYVLKVDVFMNGVSLAFCAFQVLLGYLASTAWPRGTGGGFGPAKRVIGGAGAGSMRSAADPAAGAPRFQVGGG